MGYTRQQTINMAEKAKTDISQFYNADCINYRGKTSDTGEYYTEVICEWLIDNINLFDDITMITRDRSYWTPSHKNPRMGNDESEDTIAKKMFKQKYIPILGKILDFQTPLYKYNQKGKIDLLAYSKDEKVLRVLELKKKDSDTPETMLRCVLEGYTYLKIVNQENLLRDFSKDKDDDTILFDPKETAVKTSPLVYYGGAQHKEITEGRPNLERLMALLDCKPFYYAEENGGYIIREE